MDATALCAAEKLCPFSVFVMASFPLAARERMPSPAYLLAHGLCQGESLKKLQEDQRVGVSSRAATPAKCDGAVKLDGHGPSNTMG